MILIIGAGLSGLITAYRLKQQGIPFKILEARSRIGGRILTTYGKDDCPTEMGATWFNGVHKNLIQLLDELEISYFEQYMTGTAFYQADPNFPAKSIEIPQQDPSYRIVGGTSALINALYAKLEPKDVLLKQKVKQIVFEKDSVKVISNQVFEVTRIVLALPPKLWAKKIQFEPTLSSELIAIANETQTWMEDSIKVALRYDKQFWQDKGQSGAFFSNSGPLTEFYDHSNQERKKFSLCGFMSTAYKNLSEEDRKYNVLTQLKNTFGADALNYIDYQECIWGQEENTFEKSDSPLFPHQNNGHPVFRKSFFDDRLFISSAESAKEFAGYMDGAVFAGNHTAQKILEVI